MSDMRRAILASVVLLLCGVSAQGVINPAFQPRHVWDLYATVLSARVEAVNEDDATIALTVTGVCKGTFEPRRVVLDVKAEGLEQAVQETETGQTVIVFLGKQVKRYEKEMLVCLGWGRWVQGLVHGPDRWEWTKDLEYSMAGTFNGGADRFQELLEDLAAGRGYFPSVPFTRFKEGLVLDKLPGPIRGVALYDVDGDGLLDVYACCDTGDRFYRQEATDQGRLRFVDRTDAFGLKGLAGPSVSFADVNGDGRADLLAGGVILLRTADGFKRADLLPEDAGRDVHSSSFAEINGDGYPDAIVSRRGGGLRLYLNPGAGSAGARAFLDATAAAGLDRKECGGGHTGFFAVGDWNDDGRADLFHAAGKGLLLIQGAQGRFAPARHDVSFSFESGSDASEGRTGAGVFAPIWRADRLSLIIPAHSEFFLAAEIDGAVADVTGLGNEISEATYKQLSTIAEDLNADGLVDFYTTSWSPVTPNTFHTNRGYGSFMRDEKYQRDIFPGQAHQRGAWGVAAGDVDGDGTNDLLIGGVDGSLVLFLNDPPHLRAVPEHPTADEQMRSRVRIVCARLTGAIGVLGARVTLEDADGKVVVRRDIGSNISVGCRGPDSVAMAVRSPGRYTLRVRFSDGLVASWPVDLTEQRLVRIEAARPAPTSLPAPGSAADGAAEASVRASARRARVGPGAG